MSMAASRGSPHPSPGTGAPTGCAHPAPLSGGPRTSQQVTALPGEAPHATAGLGAAMLLVAPC